MDRVWNSFKVKPVDHKTVVTQADIHLIYLARGIFAQLKPRLTLLQIVSNPESSITTVVIGTVIGYDLSVEENKTLDKLITSGLGVGKLGIPCKIPTATVVKQEKPEQKTNESLKTLPAKENMPVPTPQHGLLSDFLVNLSATIDDTGNVEFEEAHSRGMRMLIPPDLNEKSASNESSVLPKDLKPSTTPISLKLVKLSISPGDVINVTPDILQSIPSSKYSDDTWKYIKEQESELKPGNEDSYTTDYADSIDTVIYWNVSMEPDHKRTT